MSKFQNIQEEAYKANMQLPQLGLVLFTFGNVSVADRKTKYSYKAKRCSL